MAAGVSRIRKTPGSRARLLRGLVDLGDALEGLVERPSAIMNAINSPGCSVPSNTAGPTKDGADPHRGNQFHDRAGAELGEEGAHLRSPMVIVDGIEVSAASRFSAVGAALVQRLSVAASLRPAMLSRLAREAVRRRRPRSGISAMLPGAAHRSRSRSARRSSRPLRTEYSERERLLDGGDDAAHTVQIVFTSWVSRARLAPAA